MLFYFCGNTKVRSGFDITKDGAKIESIKGTGDYDYLLRECYDKDYELLAELLVPKLIKNKQATYRGVNILRDIGINVPINGIDKTAENLAEAINQHTYLKERILMGSDWYMSEMSVYSAGSYYNAMFELLKKITNKLTGTKYDVWHQFAVVNPLNFLGFLKADKQGNLETTTKNGKTAYILNMERINMYVENLEKLPNDDEWIELGEVTPFEIKNYSKNMQRKLFILKNMTIYTAEEIKENNELLLTSK